MHQAAPVRASVSCPGFSQSTADLETRWKFYLAGLRNYLERHILGQSTALGRICRAVQSSELGFNERSGRPKGTFLLLGPTGVGKTESARCFTEYLFGARSALEMIFMNEYSSDSRLCEFLERAEAAVRRRADGTTILFDEIEKAHPCVIDVLLSLLGEGQLTTLSGERLSAAEFYLVLTSNLGSGNLAKMENAPYSTLERVALDAASQSLRPELFARITERIVFRPLGLEVQKSIIEALAETKLRVLQNYFQVPLSIERGPVLAFLLRVGYNKAQGVRMLRQEVDRQFNSACLEWALTSRSPVEGKFYYDSTNGCLVLR
ncbi:MAG: AAA family ATPase [Chthoniobacterales bacterium]